MVILHGRLVTPRPLSPTLLAVTLLGAVDTDEPLDRRRIRYDPPPEECRFSLLLLLLLEERFNQEDVRAGMGRTV